MKKDETLTSEVTNEEQPIEVVENNNESISDVTELAEYPNYEFQKIGTDKASTAKVVSIVVGTAGIITGGAIGIKHLVKKHREKKIIDGENKGSEVKTVKRLRFVEVPVENKKAKKEEVANNNVIAKNDEVSN